MPKGHTNNPNGRPAGGKNQKTLEWEAFGKELMTKGVTRASKILETCDEEKFMQYFTNLTEYFQPKLARTEITGELKTEVTEIRRTVISKKVE